jgi:hypothetical protein
MLAAAWPGCSHCHGYGLRYTARLAREVPCECVYRAAFRACLKRYREEAEMMERTTGSRWEITPGGALLVGHPGAEYCADFLLAAKRSLTSTEMATFRRHFLAGLPWFACTRARGRFFHTVYRVEEKLGKVLIERGLYPTRRYFARGIDSRLLATSAMPGPNRVEGPFYAVFGVSALTWPRLKAA